MQVKYDCPGHTLATRGSMTTLTGSVLMELGILYSKRSPASQHCMRTFSSRSRASRSPLFLLSSSCFLRRVASSRSASAAAAALELRSSALPRGRKRSVRRCLREAGQSMLSSLELGSNGACLALLPIPPFLQPPAGRRPRRPGLHCFADVERQVQGVQVLQLLYQTASTPSAGIPRPVSAAPLQPTRLATTYSTQPAGAETHAVLQSARYFHMRYYCLAKSGRSARRLGAQPRVTNCKDAGGWHEERVTSSTGIQRWRQYAPTAVMLAADLQIGEGRRPTGRSRWAPLS